MLYSLGRRFKQHRLLSLSSVRAILLSATLFVAPQLSYADDFADISKHIRAGQFSEALSKVDAALAQRPKDAQMRFLKGLILTEQNKNPEAIAIFTKMTEDFPELPEPYNNLAVLYASSGQYDKARTALESAIRTHPSYATAYENLGDVYAKLASQAYDKALQADNYTKLATQAYDKAVQLDAASPSAKKKLALVRTMSSNKPAEVQLAKAATPAKAAATPAPTPAPVQVARVEPKPEAKPEPKAEVKASAKVEAKPEVKPEAKASSKAEAKPEVKKPEPKPESKSDADQDEALRTLHAWAKAWSSKDVRTYLNSYANDFQTPKGESHKAWAEERRTRIESKGRISVVIESAQV
ncbi:MAG: hypothetical protein RL748_3979, partial [Pseudomonadota bacterium]